jgi:hypothetical protein
VVIEVAGDSIVLQAVLERSTILRIAWRALRDRDDWHPGWM